MNDNSSPEYVFTQLKDDTKPISPRHFSTMFETLCTEAKLKTNGATAILNIYFNCIRIVYCPLSFVDYWDYTNDINALREEGI